MTSLEPPPSRGAALATALVLCFAAACGREVEPRPDVLLISLDSVRADALTFLDAETAPNLTRLARRGMVFTQALSGSSWTLPAHAQMFTGMPPAVHGVQLDDVCIDPATRTLPEAFAAGGWRTAGFWSGWYLSGEYGFGRGFATYRNSMTLDPRADEDLRAALEARGDAPAEALSLMREVSSHRDVTSQRIVSDVDAELDALDPDEPLFVFCHFFDPHYDYVPPPPYDTRFDPDYQGTVDGRDYWDNKAIYDAAKHPPRRISDRDLEHVRALYRGEIAWTDAAVGELIERLERDGRLRDTLIIVTADHGEEFFEHGDRGHRNTLYDEVLRVPLLIVPPGAPDNDSGPRLCDLQVTLSDVMPTALDYAGLAVPDEVYGRSLRPCLEGGELPPRPALSSLLVRYRTPDSEDPEYMLSQAVRTPESKLLRVVTFAGDRPRVRSFAQFDLQADPGERHARTEAPPREVAALWKDFEDDLDAARTAFQARRRAPAEQRVTSVRERFAGDLAGLGYTDGEVEPATGAPAWLLEPPERLPLPGAD